MDRKSAATPGGLQGNHLGNAFAQFHAVDQIARSSLSQAEAPTGHAGAPNLSVQPMYQNSALQPPSAWLNGPVYQSLASNQSMYGMPYAAGGAFSVGLSTYAANAGAGAASVRCFPQGAAPVSSSQASSCGGSSFLAARGEPTFGSGAPAAGSVPSMQYSIFPLQTSAVPFFAGVSAGSASQFAPSAGGCSTAGLVGATPIARAHSSAPAGAGSLAAVPRPPSIVSTASPAPSAASNGLHRFTPACTQHSSTAERIGVAGNGVAASPAPDPPLAEAQLTTSLVEDSPRTAFRNVADLWASAPRAPGSVASPVLSSGVPFAINAEGAKSCPAEGGPNGVSVAQLAARVPQSELGARERANTPTGPAGTYAAPEAPYRPASAPVVAAKHAPAKHRARKTAGTGLPAAKSRRGAHGAGAHKAHHGRRSGPRGSSKAAYEAARARENAERQDRVHRLAADRAKRIARRTAAHPLSEGDESEVDAAKRALAGAGTEEGLAASHTAGSGALSGVALHDHGRRRAQRPHAKQVSVATIRERAFHELAEDFLARWRGERPQEPAIHETTYPNFKLEATAITERANVSVLKHVGVNGERAPGSECYYWQAVSSKRKQLWCGWATRNDAIMMVRLILTQPEFRRAVRDNRLVEPYFSPSDEPVALSGGRLEALLAKGVPYERAYRQVDFRISDPESAAQDPSAAVPATVAGEKRTVPHQQATSAHAKLMESDEHPDNGRGESQSGLALTEHRADEADRLSSSSSDNRPESPRAKREPSDSHEIPGARSTSDATSQAQDDATGALRCAPVASAAAPLEAVGSKTGSHHSSGQSSSPALDIAASFATGNVSA